MIIIEGAAGQQSKEAIAKILEKRRGGLSKLTLHDHPGMTAVGQETKKQLEKKVKLFIARGLMTRSTN